MVAPYTATLGYWFWGIIMLVMMFSVWIKSRSIGMVLVFTALYSAVTAALLPSEMRLPAEGILAVCIAVILYRIFVSRE
jgi:hypothetical protein